MTTSEFGLSRIGQIALTVKNLEQATRFYKEVLGMKFLFDAPGMAFFQLGSIRLMIGTADKPELQHPASILYYKVEDIKEAHATLRDRGVEFEGEPALVHKAEDHDLWLAFFRDMDRNLLALMSEVPRARQGAD